MATPTTSSSTITQRLIGELAHVPDQLFSRLRSNGQLPEAVHLHTGTPGRPALAYDIDSLAALIAANTAHLSDLACRLRVALGAGPLRIVEVDGRHHLVRDDEPLQDLPADIRAAVLTQIHSDNAAAESRRTGNTNAQELQP